MKKIPFNPRTGEKASPIDPATWGSFADALSAYANGAGKGIGFVFGQDNPFTGVDLDHCIEENTGRVAPWAKAIVSKLNSYTEYSPSGTGLHIITQAHVPAGRRTDHIEIYSTGRYFTLTGNHLNGTPDAIQTHQEALNVLYHSLDDQSRKAGEMRQNALYTLTRQDEEVLAKATHARNTDRFKALWEGNTEGFRSKSEADFTLVLYLLYWTNDDIGQTKRLFRLSGLYDEEKTDSLRGTKTYLDVTIENALRKRRR
jgi:primase-polymerase (primpol)-like protein